MRLYNKLNSRLWIRFMGFMTNVTPSLTTIGNESVSSSPHPRSIQYQIGIAVSWQCSKYFPSRLLHVICTDTCLVTLSDTKMPVDGVQSTTTRQYFNLGTLLESLLSLLILPRPINTSCLRFDGPVLPTLWLRDLTSISPLLCLFFVFLVFSETPPFFFFFLF